MVLHNKSHDLQNATKFISKLKKWGFSNPYNILVNGIDEIEKHHKKIESLRSP